MIKTCNSNKNSKQYFFKISELKNISVSQTFTSRITRVEPTAFNEILEKKNERNL